MNWYSKEADNTYGVWGGLIIGIVVVVGLMLLHNADTEKDFLSPEHVMGLIAMPTVIMSYFVGKKHGEINGKRDNEN